MEPPGWYHAQGDPDEMVRYWDGSNWTTGPVKAPSINSPYPATTILADPTRRIVAKIIDVIITIVIGGIVFAIGQAIVDPSVFELSLSDILNSPELVSTGANVAAGIAMYAWNVGFVAAIGATPAKRMFNLFIADAKASVWQKPALGQAMLRAGSWLLLAGVYATSSNLLVSTLELIIFAVAAVSLVMLFTDSQHRTVMDHLARTLVVSQSVVGQPRQ